jgi:hypothetical protein
MWRRARGDALDGEVVGLGGAAGEDDIAKPAADKGRNLLARRLNGFCRLPSERVVFAGRVPEMLGEERQHGIHDARIDGRRRVRIEVDH